MKKKFILVFLLLFSFLLIGCVNNKPSKPGDNPNENPGDIKDDDDDHVVDDNDNKEIEVDEEEHSFVLISQSDNTYTYECNACKKEATVTISYDSGTQDAYTVSGNTIIFNNILENSVYTISGTFYGNIVIDISADYKLELELSGFTLYSDTECPILIKSADKITISSKKNTENFIYDLRDEVVSEDEVSASIYALCDLDIQGKGTLNVKSVNNNGIHTKDDLKIKNLTLNVDCMDNALKGNDSVTIQSGTIALIARSGDGIKTTNSSISKKGNQKGTVTINGGDILIYASRDGIDSSYDVLIDETEGTVNLQIFTDKYSKYSSETTITSDSLYYIRSSSTTYKYSILYSDDNGNEKWYSSSTYELSYGDRGRAYYYYPITKPSEYTKMTVYVYRTTDSQEQTLNYAYCSETMTLNNSFDTIVFSQERFNWTNKTMSGMGGMFDGNTDKKDVSTKGIKADNQITINSGIITINSYDDAIHTNNDVTLENNIIALGNITINGGTITIHTNDDGMHADGTLTINGGTINITNSYEGLEGSYVIINDGIISIISKDDGINGVSKTGEAIIINGGTNYVLAGGDGIDSNSQSSYDGILISGGRTVIISTGQADSSIDTERGYKYTGGYVLAIGRSGGMSNESKNCQNFNNIATTTTISLRIDNYLIVSGVVALKVPTAINAQIICLGKIGVNISTSQSSSLSFDKNGVYWE